MMDGIDKGECAVINFGHENARETGMVTGFERR